MWRRELRLPRYDVTNQWRNESRRQEAMSVVHAKIWKVWPWIAQVRRSTWSTCKSIREYKGAGDPKVHMHMTEKCLPHNWQGGRDGLSGKWSFEFWRCVLWRQNLRGGRLAHCRTWGALSLTAMSALKFYFWGVSYTEVSWYHNSEMSSRKEEAHRGEKGRQWQNLCI